MSGHAFKKMIQGLGFSVQGLGFIGSGFRVHRVYRVRVQGS